MRVALMCTPPRTRRRDSADAHPSGAVELGEANGIRRAGQGQRPSVRDAQARERRDRARLRVRRPPRELEDARRSGADLHVQQDRVRRRQGDARRRADLLAAVQRCAALAASSTRRTHHALTRLLSSCRDQQSAATTSGTASAETRTSGRWCARRRSRTRASCSA